MKFLPRTPSSAAVDHAGGLRLGHAISVEARADAEAFEEAVEPGRRIGQRAVEYACEHGVASGVGADRALQHHAAR